jgi:hypothetical protein
VHGAAEQFAPAADRMVIVGVVEKNLESARDMQGKRQAPSLI